MHKNQHVVPHPEGWAVRGENNEKYTRIHSTKNAAVADAREIARNQRAELIVHDSEGKFQYRDSYGNDPYPPRG